MKIHQVATFTLTGYEKNNKIHSTEQIDYIAKSIKEFGFLQPLVVDKDSVIVAGHGRWEAAKQLQMVEVPVVLAEGLSKAQIRRYRILDNKLSDIASWDKASLKIELTELQDDDLFDLFSDIDFSDEEDEIEERDDSIPSAPKKIIVKQGDIFQLGDHRLMCGDSSSPVDVEKLLEGQKVDMVFTDPPYNINYDFNNNGMVQSGQRTARFEGIENDNMSDEDFQKFILDVFVMIHHYLKDGHSYYISAGRESTITFNNTLKKVGFHIQSRLIRVKENFNISRLDHHPKHEVITYGRKKGKAHRWFNNRSQDDVLEFNREIGSSVHPTQKPVALLEYMINNSSKRNELIMDLFGGSGSTLITCEKHGRRCATMELDPNYMQVIIKRFNEYTEGKKEIICLNRDLDINQIIDDESGEG